MIAIDESGNIILSRGDTAAIILELDSEAPIEGAVAIVTLKRSTADTDALWVKRLPVAGESVIVTLDSEDTAHPFGKYWWDVRLIMPNGAVATPMPPKVLRIAEVVGDV